MIKKNVCKIILSVFLVNLFFVVHPSKSHAEPMREFLMSCAYGTLAGALVGVASLAFTEDPGGNFKNVAKGASLGLYAGIGLGAYLVYGVPSENSYSGWISPKFEKGKINGADLNLVVARF